jgi:hypothetical protein
MTRPVRPIALVILTICMIYPGAALVFQGVYPFVSGEQLMVAGQQGPWMSWALARHVPPIVPMLLKIVVGGLWVAGVLGLWAGDRRAMPLVIAAAVLTLFYPTGAIAMAVLALIVLFRFREDPSQVTA